MIRMIHPSRHVTLKVFLLDRITSTFDAEMLHPEIEVILKWTQHSGTNSYFYFGEELRANTEHNSFDQKAKCKK